MTLLRPDASSPPDPLPGTGPDAGDPPGPRADPDAVAAGVLCWRRAREGGGVEVLLVHRPAYDDWTWPKGKPERREALAECAVRETAEEAGVQVVLGRPLPTARYLMPDGRLKEVSYWAARVVRNGRPPGPARGTHEVDEVVWVPLDVAAQQLTYLADAVPLAALARFAESGTLATAATLVVRHATARPRDAWARADGERPLVTSGKRQAMALATLLQCWRPEYVLCSPWRRCVQTMSPYAAVSNVRIRTKNGLTEDGYRRSPAKARRHAVHLLENAHGGALCTHRPVLGGVLAAVRERSTPEVAVLVPDANPYLHPGEILVAHVASRPGRKPQVVAIERHGTK